MIGLLCVVWTVSASYLLVSLLLKKPKPFTVVVTLFIFLALYVRRAPSPSSTLQKRSFFHRTNLSVSLFLSTADHLPTFHLLPFCTNERRPDQAGGRSGGCFQGSRRASFWSCPSSERTIAPCGRSGRRLILFPLFHFLESFVLYDVPLEMQVGVNVFFFSLFFSCVLLNQSMCISYWRKMG